MRVARWGLGLVLMLAACGGTATDERATAAAVDPNNAAYLAVVEGQVSIRKADGAVVPAVAEMILARSDTLVTGKDGRVVVVLHNRHVVKLGTSLEKRVEALAHFDDPPPSQDLAELFAEALGADYERLGGKDRLERIAGWNARRAAGETPAPVAKAPPPTPPAELTEAAEPAKDVAEAPRPLELEKVGGMGSDDAPEPAAELKVDAKSERRDHPADKSGSGDSIGAKKKSAEPAKPQKRSESASKKSAEPPGGHGDGAPTPSPQPVPEGESRGESGGVALDLADAWTLETGTDGQVQRTKLPSLLASRRAALARCIADSGKTELVLTVAGGVIKAVKFGAATASCASGLVGQKLPDIADATVTVRLRR